MNENVDDVLNLAKELFELLTKAKMRMIGKWDRQVWADDWGNYNGETPAIKSVYILWNDKGNPYRPIYVGQGLLSKRLNSHSLRKWSHNKIQFITHRDNPRLAEANIRKLLERLAIIALNPEKNRG